MNKREQTQLETLLADGREIGGFEIKPLSPARVAILERRGNKLVTGGGDQSDLDAAYEVFFVVTREPAQLVAMRRAPADDWRDEVEAFALELPPDALNEFMAYLQGELEALEAVTAEPADPPEKTAETTEGRDRSGSPAVSDSPLPTVSQNMAPFGT